MSLLYIIKLKFLPILGISFILSNSVLLFGQNHSVHQLSPNNTEISFSARHFRVLKVTGEFKELEGSLRIRNGLPWSSQLIINIESIDTGDRSRDRSIKGESFFDSKHNPTISFAFQENINQNELIGILTIKGVRKEVRAPYKISRVGKQLIIEAECTLSRSEFELEFSGMDDLVSDEVKITAKIQLDLKL